MADLINHPPHYTSNPFGLETIEITRHYNFDIGNALKYILRAGRKGLGDWAGKELTPVDAAAAKVADLRKAIWYLEDEIRATRDQFAGYDLDDVYGEDQHDVEPLLDGEAEAIRAFVRSFPGMFAEHPAEVKLGKHREVPVHYDDRPCECDICVPVAESYEKVDTGPQS